MRLGWFVFLVSASLTAFGTLGAEVAMGAAATPIKAREGEEFSGLVDTISCASGALPTNISIDWGDHSATSAGTATATGGGSCEISGSHTYVEEGTYGTQVSYNFMGGISSDVGSATVSDVQPNANAVSVINATAGVAFSALLATFSDPAPEPLSSYSATIDWGDGTSSAGVVGNGFTVNGSHTYLNGGEFTATVTIHDEGGAEATPHDTVVVSGCPSAAPNSPSPSFDPTQTALDARYVEGLHHDLFGDVADPSFLKLATTALKQGETRKQLVLWMLGTGQYREGVIGDSFLRFLRRPGNQGELAFFSNSIKNGGSDEQVIASLLSSPEYYTNRGNGSSDGFLSAMYCDALFRPIDHPTQSSDDTALATGTTRVQLATVLLSSGEYLSQLVNRYYLRFLRRPGNQGELGFFSNSIKNGGSDEQVIASLLSSPEYYELFNPIVHAVTTLKANGTVHTTLSRAATLTMTVLRIEPPDHRAAASAFGAPHTRTVGVVDFGHHHKGPVTLHWNWKVQGRRLPRGSYVALLHARHGHKLIYVSDALPFRLR